MLECSIRGPGGSALTPRSRSGVDLPFLGLPSGPPTRFRLRGGDRAPDRLCTLEAVALGIIEGHPVEAGLRGALTLMVERTLFARGLLPADEVTGGPDSRAHRARCHATRR